MSSTDATWIWVSTPFKEGVSDLLDKYFPYEAWRPMQRRIAETIFEGVAQGRTVIIDAPTGIGKTAAAISAALALAEKYSFRILYLTRTRAQVTAPIRELSRLVARGVQINYSVVVSRQEMCCYEELREAPYDSFILECRLLTREGRCAYYPPKTYQLPTVPLSPESIRAALCSAGSCPYEVAAANAKVSDLVIATYYYAFAKLGESPVSADGKVVIIDEAHSLPDAVTSINTVRISSSLVYSAARSAKELGSPQLSSFLRKIGNMIAEGDEDSAWDAIMLLRGDSELRDLARRASEEFARGDSSHASLIRLAELVNLIGKLPSNYVAYIEEGEGGVLVLRPVDPYALIGDVLERAASLVLMSGTMPPQELLEAYMPLRDPTTYAIRFNEFVPPDNYLTIVDVGVTTRYSERSEGMFREYAERILALVESCPRGVLTVFPSYNLMKSVRKHVTTTDVPVVVEKPSTSLSEVYREVTRHDRFLIMAVAGGKLSEGIEYRVDGVNRLGAVAIVGVPYPEPSKYLEKRVETLIARLGSRQTAWQATYMYSAYVRVRQSIGRLFRDSRDAGVIALLDRRYVEDERWLNYLGDVMTNRVVVRSSDELLDAASHFFSRKYTSQST